MNEFNPFETLGIDPNESMPSRIPLETEQVNPMETAGQFNPFKELNINPDGTSVTPSKDTEVSSMLGIDQFTPMTDDEKQSYVDSLSDDDWNTWNNLKAEGYSFEARKALMDNQDMLYDIFTPGTGKYLQTQQKEPITSTGAQRYIDIYQDRVAGFGDRFEDRVMNKVLYKNNGEERSSKLIKGVGGFAGMVLSKGAQLIDDMLNLDAHWLAMMNNLRVIQGKQDVSTLAEIDTTKESYKSLDRTGTEMVAKSVGLGVDIAYWVPALILNTLAQGNGPIAKLINGVSDVVTGVADFTVDTVADMMMQDPKIQEYLNDPANEGMLDDFKEGLSYVGMMIMGKYLKKGGKAIGESRAGMMMNQFRNRFSSSLKSGIQRGKAGGEFAKSFNEQEGISDTDIGRSNVRRATIEGFKQGWNEKRNETPTDETVTPENGLPDKRITPYEGKEELSTDIKKETIKKQEPIANTQLTKLAEDTKLSEQNISNLKTNPDLQTAFIDTIKPYLEENGKNNPEGVITNPVNDLVYDIKAGIDELKTQQANPNRSINNQKLSPMEKALIKEIEKIINQKEPKQILKSLGKLTPAQQGLMKRIVPNLDSKIQTINQILELTKEITKGNILSKFLKFQAERPRRGVTGFAKQILYEFVKDIYDKKGIQASTEAIDNFIKGLSDEQIADITETLYKKQVGSDLDLLDKKNLSQFEELIGKSVPGENEVVEVSKEKKQLKPNDPENEQGYMNQTDAYTYDEQGNKVEHSTKDDLNLKPFDSNHTIRDILKEAGVNITYPDDRTFLRFFAKMDSRVRGGYNSKGDFIALPEHSPAVMIIMHELGHRIRRQFTEEERLKIKDNIIERGKNEMRNNGWNESDIDRYINDNWAEERMNEYIRNYSLYGNIFGKTAKEVLTTEIGKEFGQRIVNVMEKFKEELFDAFGAKNHKFLIDKIDSIVKLKPKGKEIIKRDIETEFDAKNMMDQLSDKLNTKLTLEKLNKGPDLDLTEIKNATNELKNIKINDDGYVVGDYHGHETPVYDYIEDSNLPKELKDFLKQQEIKYLEEQDKAILNRLNNLNGD